MDLDLGNQPLGHDQQGQAVFLSDLWPSTQEVEQLVERSIDADMFRRAYAGIFDGDHRWQALDAPTGSTFAWDPASTYVRRPPHLNGMPAQPPPVADIVEARVLVKLGDSITTDHISPAGAIPRDSNAGRYLASLGVPPRQLNTFASRRGNHEVMVRGAFANVRLRNQLAPGTVDGVTRCFDAGGAVLSIYEAAGTYKEHDTPVVVVAGKDYGAGSSRDWAAKGPKLLGVRAILAESFERIHRSNLVGMGILPLQFLPGQSAQSLGLTGEETITVGGFASAVADPTRRQVEVRADGTTFSARVRLDTRREADYYRHGGVLPYVLRTVLDPGRRLPPT
jgi:aconitate hydratase